jgi:3-oxoadipate enol-lactonase
MVQPATPMPPGRRISLPGRGQAWVWDSGGPPGAPTVVLSHGWTSTAALNWSACFEPLGEQFRVLAMDHRGHGRGIRSRRPFRLEDCADDMAALLEELDVGSAIVAGYSMGGPVAQLCWRRHPELVTGLVLCATAARFPRPPLSDAALGAVTAGMTLTLATVPGPVRRDALRRMVRRRPDFDAMASWAQEEVSRGDPLAYLQAGAAIARFDSGAWLGDIDVPSASVVTTKDRTVAPAAQRWLAAAIPNTAVFNVDADHRACADAVDRFVPAFLDACRHVLAGSLHGSPAGGVSPG